MSGRVLLDNPYLHVEAFDALRRVRIVRTGKPFASREALEDAFEQAADAIRGVHGWQLLLDARDAPARNDPEFEQLFGDARKRLTSRFDGIATLVKSATGKLQVARYAREDGTDTAVFDDEAKAVAYLDGRRK